MQRLRGQKGKSVDPNRISGVNPHLGHIAASLD